MRAAYQCVGPSPQGKHKKGKSKGKSLEKGKKGKGYEKGKGNDKGSETTTLALPARPAHPPAGYIVLGSDEVLHRIKGMDLNPSDGSAVLRDYIDDASGVPLAAKNVKSIR